jgi:hypothetical protein
MSDGRARLAALAGRPLDLIAYPHGETDARVADAARSAGYRLGFTTERRALGPHTDPLLIGRFQPSYASPGHTAMELVRALYAWGTRPPAQRGTPSPASRA